MSENQPDHVNRSNPKLKVVGIGFDHMHIGDQLAAAQASPDFDVVAVYDTQSERMAQVCADLGIAASMQYSDWEKMLDEHQADLAIVCSTTAEHLLWVERLAARRVHVVLEKPFAVSAEEAEKAISLARQANIRLAINWPLAWYDSHRTAYRMINEGIIGKVIEVHYYDGNRGPQYHLHAKKEVSEPVDIQSTWWFKKETGGGAMRDYLGYGSTLATWFRDGELPSRISANSYIPQGFEVDVQSVVVAHYDSGLSSFQTRWGTFTDPWVTQPQPFCGFVVVGDKGTICSRDYADVVGVQTREHPEAKSIPVDDFSDTPNVFSLLYKAIINEHDLGGPCGAKISLGGQYIVDCAVESSETERPVDMPVRSLDKP
ncbi:Gfo/Idh/MocA family protein [Ningiella sp. W23]|uniref:Gfo/Idh/MocA family protein n=1 Tax=Ningiella sp. W23 TaxID=3023715 RepID=UPI003756933F